MQIHKKITNNDNYYFQNFLLEQVYYNTKISNVYDIIILYIYTCENRTNCISGNVTRVYTRTRVQCPAHDGSLAKPVHMKKKNNKK